MDFFAHGFWSYIFFHWVRRPWLAVMCGLIPDTISWVPFFFYRLFSGIKLGKPEVFSIPDWQNTMYGIGHSLVLALAVIGIVYLVQRQRKKQMPVYMFAWPIAIFMDMLTHTREFLPTPFLWPVSSWTFPGISWGSTWFMIINYVLIVGGLIRIFVKKKRKV